MESYFCIKCKLHLISIPKDDGNYQMDSLLPAECISHITYPSQPLVLVMHADPPWSLLLLGLLQVQMLCGRIFCLQIMRISFPNHHPWICCLRALASGNFNSTLFYHSKKLLYHYTIPFYNTSTSQTFISLFYSLK